METTRGEFAVKIRNGIVLLLLASALAHAANPASISETLRQAQSGGEIVLSDSVGRSAEHGATGKIVSVGSDIFCAELKMTVLSVIPGQPSTEQTQVRCYPFTALRWIVLPDERIRHSAIRVTEF